MIWFCNGPWSEVMSGLWILACLTCIRVYPTCKSLDIRCTRTLVPNTDIYNCFVTRNFAMSYMNFDCMLFHSRIRIDEIIEGPRFSRFHGSFGKFSKIVGWRPASPPPTENKGSTLDMYVFFVLNMYINMTKTHSISSMERLSKFLTKSLAFLPSIPLMWWLVIWHFYNLKFMARNSLSKKALVSSEQECKS